MSGVRVRNIALTVLAVALACVCQRKASPAHTSTAASAAAVDTGFPVQVQDDLDRTVVVRAAPRRILSLLPSFTETVFALGAGDRIVGVDDYSDYPEATKALPKLGGLYDTQVERALSLEPDLILVSEGSAVVTPLGRGGAAVWAGSPRKFEDVYRVIEMTGRLIGRAREAALLVTQMRAQIASIEASVSGLPLVSVYYELDPSPYTVGPSSFIGVLIAKAGGSNIVPASLGDFPKINPELVVSENPAVIIGASLEDVEQRPGWAKISAVKQRRVFKWSSEEAHLVSRPGPRLPEGLRALAQRLHPAP
ncbi:MAG TPA: ABC transporter substrate-binding protein [Polyangiaceae bacterium]|jgi:iron complex transport system substrate-binding protein|nr:ABC transporter substrate-binding protein [Polyangiaceae bacterium]